MSIELLTPPISLADLAIQINDGHQRCRNAYEQALLYARDTGRLLLQAKAQLKHGEWIPWLEANCQFSRSSASAYMRVAREWAILDECAATAHLTLEDALKLLSASDRPDEPIDAEIIDELIHESPATPPKPAILEPGDRALVTNPDNLYHNLGVLVCEKRGAYYFAVTPDGEYPFLPTELEPITQLATETPPTPHPPLPTPHSRKPSQVDRLKQLLQRAYDEAGVYFSESLAREVEKELHLL